MQTAYLIPCLLSQLFHPQYLTADNVYDVRLGRDWFNYCTTAVPHAQILLSDDMCLTFSLSPLLAVCPCYTGEFLLFGPYISYIRYFKLLHLSLIMCMIRRCLTSPILCSFLLSSFLSMIQVEYMTKPLLIDIANCHNVHLPLRFNLEMLHMLVVFHLSSGECVKSEAVVCMQFVFTFYIQSDVLYMLTKCNFQIQILSSITSLV